MWKKYFIQCLTFLLALLFVVQLPLQAYAQAEELDSMYISAMSVGTAEDLIAGGYSVVYDNLNEGGTPLYIGYQFTDDPEEAITGVSALGMYGGFSELSYRDMLLNDSEGVADLGEQLQTAAQEFRSNYKAGSPYAEIAYDTLNALYVPDLDDPKQDPTPLGDYLISRDRTLEDFKQLGLMCSNVIISYILNQLCMGVADDLTDEGSTSWVRRLSDNGPFVFTDEETGDELTRGEIENLYEEEYDALYMQRAHKLYVSVAAFASDYLEAEERSGSLEEMDIPDEDTAEEAADDVCQELYDGNTLEFDEDAEAAQDLTDTEYGDLLPLGLYALLDERDEESGEPVYPYGVREDGQTRSLAEFFIEVGTMDEDEEAYRELYPLIAEQNGVTPLTEGQEILFYLSGLSNMISVGCSDEEALDQARSDAEDNVAELLDCNDGEAVSVWYDVNTDIYDESIDGVYWTSKLAREAAAHNRYDLLTKPAAPKGLSDQAKLNNAMIYAGCVGLAALGAAMVASKIIGAALAVKGLTTMVSCALMYMTGHAVAYTAAACVACVVGTVFVVIAVIAIVAILVIAIIKFFKWLFEDDDEPDLELTEIPRVIYDFNDAGEGSAVIYDSVNSPGTDEPANLNAGLKNIPWVALYYTTDPSVGEPITVEMSGGSVVMEPFAVQSGDQTAPEGYSVLPFFESYSAANLNEYRDGVTGVFCFLHHLGDAVPEPLEEGQYLMEVRMVSEKTEEAAKAKLVDMGYTVIDRNLTSDGSIDTYIGYMTTDDADDAITDLRVAYSTGQDPNSATITYGGAKYGCCGNAGNLLLMQSKWACVGSPVLASSLVVTTTLGDAPEGYEPVNLFCGGPAFDFNNCNNWEMTSADDGKEGSSKWTSHCFIYFHPSETYTSGTEYLGGLAFFSGSVASYMTELGWTQLTNQNLSGGSDSGIQYDLSGVQDGTTVLCYSMTYNPYRAIYDIQYYGAEASAQGLAYNLSLSSGGAVACDVFQQGSGGVGNNRLVRISHAYRSNNWYEGGGYYDAEQYVEDVGNQDFDRDSSKYAEWYLVNGEETACNACCTGLYVVGNSTEYISKAEPICLDELVVSSSAQYDADQMTPIRSITDCYAEEGANLALNDLEHSGSMYLYLRRADPYAKVPAYVASVTVAYVKGKDLDKTNGSASPYDTAVYSLVGNGAGRLMEINLTGAENWDQSTDTYYHSILTGSGLSRGMSTYNQAVACISHETDYGVALVWVTYTKSRTKGVSDLVLYESSAASLSATEALSVTTADGVKTEACGDGFQVGGKGSYYYLRAVYNNGNQITDLLVDTDVMTRDYWTTISTTGLASSYDTYFIKARHYQKDTMTYYISGIYSASGSTDKEALKSLLSQGCRYFCPYDLDPWNQNSHLYVGYTMTTSYKKAYSGLILYDAGQNNTVDTIIKGRDTYVRVTDSLNSGVYDSIISIYLTNSARKACENGAAKASAGHYITGITFFHTQDLNDYATGEKKLEDLDDETRAYVESYIYDEEGNPVYWDIVTDSTGKVINSNLKVISTDQAARAIRLQANGKYVINAPTVYMYVHYSDNLTPNLDSLNGSIFTDDPVMGIAVIAGGSMILMAAVYLLRKKHRKGAENA